MGIQGLFEQILFSTKNIRHLSKKPNTLCQISVPSASSRENGLFKSKEPCIPKPRNSPPCSLLACPVSALTRPSCRKRVPAPSKKPCIPSKQPHIPCKKPCIFTKKPVVEDKGLNMRETSSSPL